MLATLLNSLAVTTSTPFHWWEVALMICVPAAALLLGGIAIHRIIFESDDPGASLGIVIIIAAVILPTLAGISGNRTNRLIEIQEDEHEVLFAEYAQDTDLDYEVEEFYATGWNGGSFSVKGWPGDCRFQYRVDHDGVTSTFHREDFGTARTDFTRLGELDEKDIELGDQCHR